MRGCAVLLVLGTASLVVQAQKDLVASLTPGDVVLLATNADASAA